MIAVRRADGKIRDTVTERLSSPPAVGGTPRSHHDGITVHFPDSDGEGDQASVLSAERGRLQSMIERANDSTTHLLLPPRRASPLATQEPLVPSAADVPSADDDKDITLHNRWEAEGDDTDMPMVIDWRAPASLEIAQQCARIQQPLFLSDPAAAGGRTVFDNADAEVGPRGYPTGRTKRGETPQLYPFRTVSDDDLGRIGGSGLRIYFYVLKRLCMLFAVLSVVSIPALLAYTGGAMYDAPSASRFASGIARSTIGNIVASEAELENGSHGGLWLASLVDVLCSMVLLVTAALASRRIKNITRMTDAAMVSMSDYTVRITPAVPWGLHSKLIDGERKLTADIRTELNAKLPGCEIADLPGGGRNGTSCSVNGL
jgi:hypothetical protein